MPAAFPAGVIVGNSGTFYGTAAGNVDMDTTLDQWSISDTNRSGNATSTSTQCAVGNNPGGEPCNDYTDI
jgi:hypothetical protein